MAIHSEGLQTGYRQNRCHAHSINEAISLLFPARLQFLKLHKNASSTEHPKTRSNGDTKRQLNLLISIPPCFHLSDFLVPRSTLHHPTQVLRRQRGFFSTSQALSPRTVPRTIASAVISVCVTVRLNTNNNVLALVASKKKK